MYSDRRGSQAPTGAHRSAVHSCLEHGTNVAADVSRLPRPAQRHRATCSLERSEGLRTAAAMPSSGVRPQLTKDIP
jgi:hypothetical protein